MKRTLGGMFVFGMMVAILVGALQLFNWVPSALQDGALQQYASVDEVRAHLRIGTVYQPAYYPRSVQWPPVLVAAQTRPYKAVITEFARSDAPDRPLASSRARTRIRSPPGHRAPPGALARAWSRLRSNREGNSDGEKR